MVMGRMTVQTVASSLDMCHSNEPVGENNNNESMNERMSTPVGLIRSLMSVIVPFNAGPLHGNTNVLPESRLKCLFCFVELMYCVVVIKALPCIYIYEGQ